MDGYLKKLDVELGPVPRSEQLAAKQWAAEALGS